MITTTSRALLTLLAAGGLCGVAHADRPQFGAGLTLDQISENQLSGTGDSVTYTEVSGAVDAKINNRRVVLSTSYRLSYRIPEIGDVRKSVNQSGVLRMESRILDEWLSADAGAIVTHSRMDAGGAAPLTDTANPDNLAQTYSFFIRPTLSHRFGDVGVAVNYRFGYTRNESRQAGANADLLNDRFDDSTNQQLSGSIGMQDSFLPFDWSAGAQYGLENTGNLKTRNRSIAFSGEVKVPVSNTIALASSVGYSKDRGTEASPLINPVTRLPVFDTRGRFVVDPTGPRVLNYDLSSINADAGIIWRPSQRSRVELRAGRRYGGFSVTGLVELRPDKRSGLTIAITDGIESFGRSVTGGLASSPADLNLGNDTNSPFQDCLFGKTPGSGSCFGSALGSAAASSYREQAANIIYTHGMRRWNLSLSGGYSRRTYLDNPDAPLSLDGVVDESFFGDVSLSGRITRKSGVSFSFSGSLFKNGQVGQPDVISGSFSTGYNRTIGRAIGLQANLAVDASKQDGDTANVSGRAQLGIRYQF